MENDIVRSLHSYKVVQQVAQHTQTKKRIYSKAKYPKDVQSLLRKYRVGKDDLISIVHMDHGLLLVTFMGIKPEEDD